MRSQKIHLSMCCQSARGPFGHYFGLWNVRCGGFGDFIDVELDDFGRPWIALAHNAAGTEEAVIGTLMTGPSLYGEVVQLPVLPVGGVSSPRCEEATN